MNECLSFTHKLCVKYWHKIIHTYLRWTPAISPNRLPCQFSTKFSSKRGTFYYRLFQTVFICSFCVNETTNDDGAITVSFGISKTLKWARFTFDHDYFRFYDYFFKKQFEVIKSHWLYTNGIVFGLRKYTKKRMNWMNFCTLQRIIFIEENRFSAKIFVRNSNRKKNYSLKTRIALHFSWLECYYVAIH